MKPTIVLDLGDGRTSEIYIGTDLLQNRTFLAEKLGNTRNAVTSNDTVFSLYGEVFDKVQVEYERILIGDGEEFKSFDTYREVLDTLIKYRFNRDTTIVALGGGVVGDLAGFVAATYQRGVRLVQVPTTLLAQVDSAVGGKTAINHEFGKNLVGAFYQPAVVLIDIATLRSLPDRIFLEGLAEVIKYGVIADAEFFEWLENNVSAIQARESSALEHIVRRSCEIKADVVAADEREQGLRAILNYGHTFGHALEIETGYGQLLHGEAVSVGMVMAADLASRDGRCSRDTAQRIKGLLDAFSLPTQPPSFDKQALLSSMSLDKKVVGGKVRFVLPSAIGSVAVASEVAKEHLDQTLDAGAGLCS